MPDALTESSLRFAPGVQRIARTARAAGLLANDWAMAGLIFLVTRLISLVGAYSGVVPLIAAEPQRNKGWVAELALLWDSAWYAGIAEGSYSYDPAAPGGTNVAFAPLYPFLMRGVSKGLHLLTFGWDWGNGRYGSLIVAGFLVSNISLFVALALLIRLLSPRLGRGGAMLVALGLASLPTAFFFSALYTEGLFLLLVVAVFVLARSNWQLKWLCVGMVGMLATLDKFAGVILLPAMLLEYMSQRGWQWRKVRLDVLCLGLIPVGFAIYSGFLWWRFGSAFVLNNSMFKGWNHQASFFLLTYWDSVAQLWQSLSGAVPPDQDPVLHYGMGSRLYLILDLALPLILVVGAFIARKRLLASEWAWLAMGIIYPLSTNITFSMARYVLPLWPGLIWLGTLRSNMRWIAAACIALSLVLLAWCSHIFGGARWIG